MKTNILYWPLAFLVLFVVSGCERGMLDQTCTQVASGQLVISEIRGSQAGVDTYGQWIEIHNTAPSAIDVAGIELRLRQLDGTSQVSIVVRQQGVGIEANGYLVLGRFEPGNLPDHVDYGYTADFESDLYADGILDLYVCGELVDTVIYHNLPETGSLAFDGGLDLTTSANDDENNWCNDATSVGDNPTEVGTPGTPGEQNLPCN